MGKEDLEEGKRFAALIGAQVRGEAAARGMSISALARAIPVERVTFGRYVSGERPMPLHVLHAAAAEIGVPMELIIQRARERM